jgi:hypothetical protein
MGLLFQWISIVRYWCRVRLYFRSCIKFIIWKIVFFLWLTLVTELCTNSGLLVSRWRVGDRA